MLATLFYYLPILINPSLILNRDNDLQQQFWPIFYFIKEQFWRYHQLPLWNNMFFSGLPLLPDPQFSLFYPPNLIFLILPLNLAFIIYFIFHIFFGGIGIYLLMKQCFKTSVLASLFASFAFIFSPRLAGYLEAGHSGLVASWGLLPWVTLATFMLAKNPRYRWTAILGASLAGIFFTHTVTFGIATGASVILFLILITLYSTQHRKPSVLHFLGGLLAMAGLSAVSLLPQIEWAPQTTRFLLLQHPDVYPKWFSIKELFFDTFLPYLNKQSQLQNINTEKWLSLGLFTSLLALWSFWRLKRKEKVFLFFSVLAVILVSLNNASPLYKLLMKIDWYTLSRIATRDWFILILTVTVLAGLGLDKLIKSKTSKFLISVIIFLSLAELIFLSWSKILKPLPQANNYVPAEVYQFLNQDKDRFRVFCVERCFSQQNATKAHLELVEGYNTLQQTNYYKHMWQLSGGYWNYYTLGLPPQGDFKDNKLQPDAKSLGAYNTKYVLSSYPLTDKNFSPIKQFGKFFVYQNNLYKSRAYFKNANLTNDNAPILEFSPNHIRVDTSKHLSNQLILAEVFSKGWKAYLNGNTETEVLETPSSLRLVNISPDTDFVDFRYQPQSFMIGEIITIATVILLIAIPLINKRIIKK